MKRVRDRSVAVLVAGVVAVGGATVASAAGLKSAAWTESKAELVVTRDAVVKLSPADRAAIEDGLVQAVRQYKALELAALDMRDEQAASRYHNIGYGLSSALAKVRNGLAVAGAECSGAGPAVAGGRFTRFRCLVTSEELTIPSPELGSATANGLPSVVDGRARVLDAVEAWLMVRTTGKSTMSYRQVAAQGFVPS